MRFTLSNLLRLFGEVAVLVDEGHPVQEAVVTVSERYGRDPAIISELLARVVVFILALECVELEGEQEVH